MGSGEKAQISADSSIVIQHKCENSEAVKQLIILQHNYEAEQLRDQFCCETALRPAPFLVRLLCSALADMFGETQSSVFGGKEK